MSRVGPLSGVFVADFSRVLTGPFCSTMLADLGADVVKVEQPGHGDDTRSWGPPFVAGESSYFLSVNRNKRSLVLDLKNPEAAPVVRALFRRADVVLENFRPGTADRLGIGYARAAAENPRLVYCSISGFGQTGPYRDRPGYDLIIQGMAGLMGLTGEVDGPPTRVGLAVTDVGAGMWAAFAIAAALYAREPSGRGQYLDVSMLDGAIAWDTYMAGHYLVTGENPRRPGSGHPTLVPYQPFPTADGSINVAVGNDAMWQTFCGAVGRPDLAADPRYATGPDRVEHRARLVPALAAMFATRTTAHWTEALLAAGIPCGPVNTMADILTDPHVAARQMVTGVDHPTAGHLQVTGVPVKFSDTPGAVDRPPPLLGQHTDEVLADLGFADDAVADLRRQGVVA